MTSAVGPETNAAMELYRLSPHRVPAPLLRAVATVKIAACRCNRDLGYLPADVAETVINNSYRFQRLDDDALLEEVSLDAYQGGAGTSINMAVNEWLGARSDVDPHAVVNLHQSTNDVMPTALRLMMHELLATLEEAVEALQGVLQKGERAHDLTLKIGRTQLRDAAVTTLGREYATWAHAVSRDRWRCFKARERIREVNLGGTAVGTGAGAPRQYVLKVCRYLQEEVDHPISRAEHLAEATSNYDQVVEAMNAIQCLAVDLRRIASDLRLLSSGPRAGFGELDIPELLPGSSIMAGKINPVIPEAVIQASERILANDALIGRLASMSELELNAFFPAISHTVYESITLALGATRSMTDYLPLTAPRIDHRTDEATQAQAQTVALLPLLNYEECTQLLTHAENRGQSLRQLLTSAAVLEHEEAEAIFAPSNLVSLGYDEELYASLRHLRADALRELLAACNKEKPTA